MPRRRWHIFAVLFNDMAKEGSINVRPLVPYVISALKDRVGLFNNFSTSIDAVVDTLNEFVLAWRNNNSVFNGDLHSCDLLALVAERWDLFYSSIVALRLKESEIYFDLARACTHVNSATCMLELAVTMRSETIYCHGFVCGDSHIVSVFHDVIMALRKLDGEKYTFQDGVELSISFQGQVEQVPITDCIVYVGDITNNDFSYIEFPDNISLYSIINSTAPPTLIQAFPFYTQNVCFDGLFSNEYAKSSLKGCREYRYHHLTAFNSQTLAMWTELHVWSDEKGKLFHDSSAEKAMDSMSGSPITRTSYEHWGCSRTPIRLQLTAFLVESSEKVGSAYSLLLLEKEFRRKYPKTHSPFGLFNTISRILSSALRFHDPIEEHKELAHLNYDIPHQILHLAMMDVRHPFNIEEKTELDLLSTPFLTDCGNGVYRICSAVQTRSSSQLFQMEPDAISDVFNNHLAWLRRLYKDSDSNNPSLHYHFLSSLTFIFEHRPNTLKKTEVWKGACWLCIELLEYFSFTLHHEREEKCGERDEDCQCKPENCAISALKHVCDMCDKLFCGVPECLHNETSTQCCEAASVYLYHSLMKYFLRRGIFAEVRCNLEACHHEGKEFQSFCSYVSYCVLLQNGNIQEANVVTLKSINIDLLTDLSKSNLSKESSKYLKVSTNWHWIFLALKVLCRSDLPDSIPIAEYQITCFTLTANACASICRIDEWAYFLLLVVDLCLSLASYEAAAVLAGYLLSFRNMCKRSPRAEIRYLHELDLPFKVLAQLKFVEAVAHLLERRKPHECTTTTPGFILDIPVPNKQKVPFLLRDLTSQSCFDFTSDGHMKNTCIMANGFKGEIEDHLSMRYNTYLKDECWKITSRLKPPFSRSLSDNSSSSTGSVARSESSLSSLSTLSRQPSAWTVTSGTNGGGEVDSQQAEPEPLSSERPRRDADGAGQQPFGAGSV